jgi:phospholipid transport system substrate-binding protein
MLKKLILVAALTAIVSTAGAGELPPPHQILEKSSQELLVIAKTDKDVAAGNRKRIVELVEQKLVPLMDFDRITADAAGRHWREATPDQQARLKTTFSRLLINTYSSAIASLRDKQIIFSPARSGDGDTEVVVKSKVVGGSKTELDMSYRMERRGDKWLVCDVNIMGAWLVESYKSSFNSEIERSGIDGLIKMLDEKNARIATKSLKS